MRTDLARLLLSSALMLLLSPAAGALEPAAAIHEPDAVLLNISEADLNRVILAALRSGGGLQLEGTKARAARGVFGVRYRADLSEPVLELGEDGRARVSLNILDGGLWIGRLERKLMRRLAACENAGISVNPDRPVDVTLALRFRIEDGDLRIDPEQVQLANTGKGFRLVKPSRCTNTFLPKWLLWWIGKPHLRHYLGELDEMLLSSVRKSAASLNANEGLLRKHWRVASSSGSRGAEGLFLYPQSLDTSHGSLFVSLAGSSTDRAGGDPPSPEWLPSLAGRSFLGLSQSFMNAVVRTAFEDRQARRHRPRGRLEKIFNSRAVLALIPGLREIDATKQVYYTLSFRSAPDIEFARLDAAEDADGVADDDRSRAIIRVHLSGIEIELIEAGEDGERHLGTLRIDSGSVGLLPYANLLGGISFETVENEWAISSTGFEFDEGALAATLQEMVFGEIFETGYEPIARDAFAVGTARFQPRYFTLAGTHLVVGLTGR